MNVKVRATAADATIYGVESGGSPISNPVAADSLGRMLAWADRGEYNAIIAGTGITTYTIPVNATPAGNREMDDVWLPSGFAPSILTNTGAGTTPAFPIDGQSFIWAPALAPVGPVEFRYRSASSSAYKWECVGGAGFGDSQFGGTRSVTSGIFNNWNTGWTAGTDLATFTAPFTGEYDCEGFITLSAPTTTQTVYGAGICMAGGSNTQGSANWSTTSTGYLVCLIARARVTISAGDTIDLRGSMTVSGGPFTVTRYGTGLRVVPARIL
jgi:hypothetical protein